MNVHFKNVKYSYAELTNGKVIQNKLSPFEKSVLKFLKRWLSSQNTINQDTSGSTGKAKNIKLTKEQLSYSAEETLAFLDPENTMTNCLIAISPAYIGGKMLLIRAVARNLEIFIAEPDDIDSFLHQSPKIDLVSLVPIQIKKLFDKEPELLSKFGTILIGGAPLNSELENKLEKIKNVRFFKTYGMTETASHIALCEIGKDWNVYKTLGDACISVDNRNCLRIKGTVTNHEWIQTNDIVELLSHSEFKWVGRSDNVINSGGIKISPEKIEQALDEQINFPFFIAGIYDAKLGQKVILLVEATKDQVLNIHFDNLDKYHIPKELIKLNSFEYTASGKINRPLTLKKIER